MFIGEWIFSNCIVIVIFWWFNMLYEEWKVLEVKVKEELMMDGIDYIDDFWLCLGFCWYGKCKSVKVEDDLLSNLLMLIVEFDVYFFVLRENIFYFDVFDDDYFIDDSVDNWIGYYIYGKREIFFINMGVNVFSLIIKVMFIM